MKYKKEIEKIGTEIDELLKLETQISNELGSPPKERLRCETKKNKYYNYYQGNKYLGKKDEKTISELANYEYKKKLLKLLNEKIKNLLNLKEILSKDYEKPNDLYDKLHPAKKKYVTPILSSRENNMRNWLAEEYEKWEITDEDVKGNFITNNGERVRSKSEKIIADELKRYGIYYKYEYPLKLKQGRIFVEKRPDFIALNCRTLKEIIIEHLGLFDNEEYFMKNVEKIDLYEKNGYLIGKNLILLHETYNNPLDTEVLDRYIEEYLL